MTSKMSKEHITSHDAVREERTWNTRGKQPSWSSHLIGTRLLTDLTYWPNPLRKRVFCQTSQLKQEIAKIISSGIAKFPFNYLDIFLKVSVFLQGA